MCQTLPNMAVPSAKSKLQIVPMSFGASTGHESFERKMGMDSARDSIESFHR